MSQVNSGLFLAYGALMLGALGPIYYGSHQSLHTPKATRDLLKRLRKELPTEEDEEEEDEEEEEEDTLRVGDKVTSGDAWLFPVFGSIVLFGMYLIFRYLNKEYINLLLSFYFGLIGAFALSTGLISISHSLLPRSTIESLEKFKLQLSKAGEELITVRFTSLDLSLASVAIALTGGYIITRHWVLSNLLALSLSLNAVRLMELDSFVTGSIMLGGLFLYDIFWVFGTEVMVSVARNFDAPIKILWPKNLLQELSSLLFFDGSVLSPKALVKALGGIKWQFTMLGLGDIVIPGIFIALALRYDQHIAAVAAAEEFQKTHHITRQTKKKAFLAEAQRHLVTKRGPPPSEKEPNSSSSNPNNFAKPYFHATFIAYIAGLSTTMLVMHVFRAAQPALLYLSPACVLAVVIQSLLRGEWKQVWSWTDADAEADEKKKEGDEKAGDKQEVEGTKKGGSKKPRASKKSDVDEDDVSMKRRTSSRRRKPSIRAREADIDIDL